MLHATQIMPAMALSELNILLAYHTVQLNILVQGTFNSSVVSEYFSKIYLLEAYSNIILI